MSPRGAQECESSSFTRFSFSFSLPRAFVALRVVGIQPVCVGQLVCSRPLLCCDRVLCRQMQ
eukprot:4830771-Alexandrium_andersonii.AAC.1